MKKINDVKIGDLFVIPKGFDKLRDIDPEKIYE